MPISHLRLLPHLLLRFLRRASHRAGVVRALPFLRSRRGALPSARRLQQIVLLAHSPRLLGLAAAAAERVEHACRAGGWGSERRAVEEAGPAVRCVGRPRGGLRDVKKRSLRSRNQ